MFRLQNNVPEVYPDRSRDFQLFCRLYDSIFGGVKFSIDSLQRSTNTKECDSSLLELLKTKLGLFTSIEVDERELRFLLQVFPTIIRYKGSKRALNYVLTLYSRITNVFDTFAVYDVTALEKEHRLILSFTEPLADDRLLTEILKYILPAGYIIEYRQAEVCNPSTSTFTKDQLEYIVAENQTQKYNSAKVKRLSNNNDPQQDNLDKIPLTRTVGVTLVTSEIPSVDDKNNSEEHS